MSHTAFIETPLGMASITGDENGIAKISITENSEKKSSITIPEPLREAVVQLQDYFEGNRSDFSIKLNPSGTDFQKKVWRELATIPFGKTVSYLVIPCHRVIGSDGSLTGYAGGLWRKKWLLAHESPAKQQTLF